MMKKKREMIATKTLLLMRIILERVSQRSTHNRPCILAGALARFSEIR
jgi:hypothetical protein